MVLENILYKIGFIILIQSLSFKHEVHLPWAPTPTVARVICSLLLPVMILRLLLGLTFWQLFAVLRMLPK